MDDDESEIIDDPSPGSPMAQHRSGLATPLQDGVRFVQPPILMHSHLTTSYAANVADSPHSFMSMRSAIALNHGMVGGTRADINVPQGAFAYQPQLMPQTSMPMRMKPIIVDAIHPFPFASSSKRCKKRGKEQGEMRRERQEDSRKKDARLKQYLAARLGLSVNSDMQTVLGKSAKELKRLATCMALMV